MSLASNVSSIASGTANDVGNDVSSFLLGPIAQDARNTVDTLSNNPALYIQLNNLGYILAIVAGALFLVGAILALFNLIRDRFGIHLIIIIFALERVATYVIRALLYKKPKLVYVEVFEILEAAGTFLIFTILYHIWAGTLRRRRADGSSSKGGRCGHCCILLIATFWSLVGSALFIAGAVLQDRNSATLNQYERGFKLRKAAVIVYGAVIAVFDVLCLFLCCRRHSRSVMPGLLICGALLSAKAGFQIYAIWHNVGRYYENKFFWPLFVLTELLALLILVFPGFVRRAFAPTGTPLPITDDGNAQYIAGNGQAQPYAPQYGGPAIQPVYK